MEFWEGAVLVVGGVWLVGRMSRNLPSHPLNAASAVAAGTANKGLTTLTNTDDSVSLIVGEPLAPQTVALPVTQRVAIDPVARVAAPAPVALRPIAVAPENVNMVRAPLPPTRKGAVPMPIVDHNKRAMMYDL